MDLQDALKKIQFSEKLTNNFIQNSKKIPVYQGLNGDVYPCHVLSNKEFKLGNSLTDKLEQIIDRASISKFRTKSTEIEQCSSCHFVLTCHSGCRADAYFNENTFNKPDSMCETLFKFQVNNIIQGRTGKRVQDVNYAI
ncbi:SPASM domain-containing protein [Saccharicrinis aurantiacus]|uniref:SPASM domain-containing protein n=1 Tax=Saccharicrinis aurantiacus TaxID=1849719 RepID=UPI00094F829F|nr:SPASM domain-containing protein [Saccharicrinis aurantiacus]